MVKKYYFNGVGYSSVVALRDAIFKETRTVFGNPKKGQDENEFWSKLGVHIIEEELQLTEDQKQQQELIDAKRRRRAAVATIIVDVDGMKFEGDETSQDRMTRSIVAMADDDMIPWVLADNSIVQVTKAQLKQALRLSGLKQAELWVVPYTE